VDPEQGDEKGGFPGPSLWPIGVAIGLACILVGLVVSWWVVAIGGAVTLFFGLLWLYELAGGSLTRARAKAVPEPVPGAPARREFEGPPTDRKGFLSAATLGLGAAIGAAVTIPPVLFAILPPFLKGEGYEDKNVDLGPLENFQQDQWMITRFTLYPGQGGVAKRTAYIRYNGLLESPDTGREEPSFTILSSRCVHLGCPVQPNGPLDEGGSKAFRASGQRVDLTPVIPAGFGCPCHGGQYDTEGNRTAGPPVRALDRFAYSIKRGRLYLTGGFSVGQVTGTGKDAEITRYKQAAPGIHIDGWEQVLYPLIPPS
jgi:menaquinol-cytochrome c reductase iron-sulfur subunit